MVGPQQTLDGFCTVKDYCRGLLQLSGTCLIPYACYCTRLQASWGPAGARALYLPRIIHVDIYWTSLGPFN